MTEYKLKNITYAELNKLKQEFVKKQGKIIVDGVRWWYKENDFCKFILDRYNVPPRNNNVKYKWNKNLWDCKAIPILKHLFVTYTEYKEVLHNIAFTKGYRMIMIDSEYFQTYLMLRLFGGISYKDLSTMPTKVASILYLYGIGTLLRKPPPQVPVLPEEDEMFR
jgi:hypothetical protein